MQPRVARRGHLHLNAAMAATLTYQDARSAIQLELRLASQLRSTPSSEWPHHLREFFEQLTNVPIEDRSALLVVLMAVVEELHLLTGARRGRDGALQQAFAATSIPTAELLRRIEAELVAVTAGPDRVAPSANVRRLLAVIDEHYPERLRVEDLARAVSRERGHVSNIFRRETGLTVHHYLTRVRMRHAADLVRRGEKIEAVMLMVGYRSKRSFYQQFRAELGVTPGAYRLSCGSGRAEAFRAARQDPAAGSSRLIENSRRT